MVSLFWFMFSYFEILNFYKVPNTAQPILGTQASLTLPYLKAPEDSQLLISPLSYVLIFEQKQQSILSWNKSIFYTY